MNEDLINRLAVSSERLHLRGLEVIRENRDSDIAVLMSGVAVAMEALRIIGEQVDGLQEQLARLR
ncbi:hypothetical protein [Brucella intermedia]|uniref:hypothetical protein n=1 Tax=Brucella intermedia TaxID=94625 RepID=UPI00046A74EC|nr:hypothetical protein [Brucella intermedia]